MLLAEKPRAGGTAWPARFVSRASFIACQGRQDDETGRGLLTAFARGDWQAVKSLRLAGEPDATCWAKGEGWWLSTKAP